jgi:hypothetical protein
MDYGLGKFFGSTSKMIVLLYEPPACLRVLDPTYDRFLPGTPENLDAAMQFSDPSRFVGDVEIPASLPPQIQDGDSNPMAHWCFYFQKADLARQEGDWAQVAALGDVALKLDDSPNHASERVPFIEGYAHMNEWDTALRLTLEAIEINKFMGPMLCSTWERIAQDTPEEPARGKTVQTVEARLGCGLNTGNAD